MAGSMRGAVHSVSGFEYAEAKKVAFEAPLESLRLDCSDRWTRSAQGVNLSRLVLGINETA
jgi:hypothetical protein